MDLTFTPTRRRFATELPLAHPVMIDHELGDEDQHLARCIALGREGAASAMVRE